MALNRTDFGRFHSGQSKELLRALAPVSDLLSAEVAITATAAEINTLGDQELLTQAGLGITSGVGTVYESSVRRIGNLVYTNIFLDLAGLSSATSDLDIIGVGVSPASLGQITTAQNGSIIAGKMTCLEVPASLTDIDLYSANEGTGAFEDSVTGTLTGEIALVTSGAAWTAALTRILTGFPTDGQYVYIVNGAADTADPFTAGKFLIELVGVAS